MCGAGLNCLLYRMRGKRIAIMSGALDEQPPNRLEDIRRADYDFTTKLLARYYCIAL